MVELYFRIILLGNRRGRRNAPRSLFREAGQATLSERGLAAYWLFSIRADRIYHHTCIRAAAFRSTRR